MEGHSVDAMPAPAHTAPATQLLEVNPEQVFRDCYERSYDAQPSETLLAAFHELLDEVGRERPGEEAL